ncbi:hypothetical protein Goklo_021287 [Gossypium klotzschianum]|uniref:Uncharacterized protein n=1 Tax=Gossypium klotzschianum TaxID=34286 RepID=A0A7J8UUW8_9ROSI|nr:hypothetical protein [Gossypium klotzschianum]
MSSAWKQIHRMKRFTVGVMKTPEYYGWWSKKVNDNIPRPREEGVRSIKEYLQVVPSEIEIIKQYFEKRNSELGKKIEQLEEEKMHLRLDVDVQTLETEKLRKWKNKAEEDLDSLRIDYKKLQSSMKTVGLRKTSEQWRQEIREEKIKADSCEIRIELLEAGKDRQKEQVHFFQNQVTNKDHIMGEAMAQIWELTQLLAGGNDKGKDPMVNVEEGDNDGPLYPLGFTPPHVQPQADVHPLKSAVTIRP